MRLLALVVLTCLGCGRVTHPVPSEAFPSSQLCQQYTLDYQDYSSSQYSYPSAAFYLGSCTNGQSTVLPNDATLSFAGQPLQAAINTNNMYYRLPSGTYPTLSGTQAAAGFNLVLGTGEAFTNPVNLTPSLTPDLTTLSKSGTTTVTVTWSAIVVGTQPSTGTLRVANTNISAENVQAGSMTFTIPASALAASKSFEDLYLNIQGTQAVTSGSAIGGSISIRLSKIFAATIVP